MSYAKIEINLPDPDQRGSIQRSFPVPLRSHVQEYQWTQFCDAMDEICEQTQKKISRAKCVGIGISIASFFTSFFFVSGIPFLVFVTPLAIFGFVAGAAGGSCVATRRQQEGMKLKQQLCDRTSKDWRTVTINYNEKMTTTGNGSDRHVTSTAWIDIRYPEDGTAIAIPGESDIPVAVSASVLPGLEDKPSLAAAKNVDNV